MFVNCERPLWLVDQAPAGGSGAGGAMYVRAAPGAVFIDSEGRVFLRVPLAYEEWHEVVAGLICEHTLDATQRLEPEVLALANSRPLLDCAPEILPDLHALAGASRVVEASSALNPRVAAKREVATALQADTSLEPVLAPDASVSPVTAAKRTAKHWGRTSVKAEQETQEEVGKWS